MYDGVLRWMCSLFTCRFFLWRELDRRSYVGICVDNGSHLRLGFACGGRHAASVQAGWLIVGALGFVFNLGVLPTSFQGSSSAGASVGPIQRGAEMSPAPAPALAPCGRGSNNGGVQKINCRVYFYNPPNSLTVIEIESFSTHTEAKFGRRRKDCRHHGSSYRVCDPHLNCNTKYRTSMP